MQHLIKFKRRGATNKLDLAALGRLLISDMNPTFRACKLRHELLILRIKIGQSFGIDELSAGRPSAIGLKAQSEQIFVRFAVDSPRHRNKEHTSELQSL